MKKIAIFIALIFTAGSMQAQKSSTMVQKGEVITMGKVSATGYKHINFPRKNFIIKRGALANFNALNGEKVVVHDVFTENGDTKIMLKRKNGTNFFRFWTVVEANLEKAIANGELILHKKNNTNAIVRF